MRNVLKRHIALPQDHGSWVFLFSPLLIGLFAGQKWSAGSVYLIIAAVAAFLIRQPITIAIKIYSGRRPRRELPAAFFWIALYTILGLIGLTALVLLGHTYTLYLALPGIPVFAWHLYLVSRRAERRQIGIELVATGVLALAAPAALWVGLGSPVWEGWLLWLLVWLQSAGSIVYAYLRLEQRAWAAVPPAAGRLKAAFRSLLYVSFNLLLALILALFNLTSPWLVLPYLLQWSETVWGAMNPAIGYKATRIGIRQLIVSSVFTVLFILAWGR